MYKLVSEHYGIPFDESSIPMDDKKTWDLISRADCLGVFQMGSPVAAPILKKIKPNNIDELSAVTAFIRPGASGLEDYLRAKDDHTRLPKYDPRIDKFLLRTHGALIYQEQQMQLISTMLNITFGEADLYRRALEKPKKNQKTYDKFINDFVGESVKNGFDKNLAEFIQNLIIENSGYSFNACLAGNEKIYRLGTKNNNLSIGEMYKIKNNREYAMETGHYQLWEKEGYGLAYSMQTNEKLYPNDIVDIRFAGIRSVYKVTTESNKYITCTMNHKFPTPNGKKELSELNIGDELYIYNEEDFVCKEELSTKLDKIISIEFVKNTETYDVEMKTPYHNFLVDGGIVTSNSHAIAYSYVTYFTAYMKANYPLAFYTVMLNGKEEKFAEFLNEAKQKGIIIKHPDINKSKFLCSIEEENVIRIGLQNLKGLGPAATTSILEKQPYSSFNEFYENKHKSVNKTTIESLIQADAFNIDIIVDTDHYNLKEYEIASNRIKLDRLRFLTWFQILEEMKTKKTISNYEVPITLLTQRQLRDNNFTVEKDGQTVVLPEDMINKFGINVEQVIKTRKRPKGILKKEKEVIQCKYSYILEQNKSTILSQKDNLLIKYLAQMQNFGISFVQHPLDAHIDKIGDFDSVGDGDIMQTAGIMTKLDKRSTKKGKPYYMVELVTPRGTVNLRLWDENYKKNKEMLVVNNILLVIGTKGFGAINPEKMKVLTATTE